MTFPASLLDPSYGPMVTGAVVGEEAEIAWTPITASGNGRTVTFLFSARPLRVGGVFVNVSATIQQQCADALGALLPTPKMMDLAWLARGATIPPMVMPIASTAQAMLAASARLDKAMGDAPGALVCQKTWCIANSLATKPGTALNYGFFCLPTAGTSWNGIATEACVSFPLQPQKGRVIQGQGWAHNAQHLDYSQVAPFVHRTCQVDGHDADLADVLVDPELAPLVSHEGVLTLPGLRQPGVPIFACKLRGVGAGRAFTGAGAPAGMCPTPPKPTNIERAGPDWGLVGACALALGAVVGGFWLALRLAGRRESFALGRGSR